jgi:hypothetical protein
MELARAGFIVLTGYFAVYAIAHTLQQTYPVPHQV